MNIDFSFSRSGLWRLLFFFCLSTASTGCDQPNFVLPYSPSLPVYAQKCLCLTSYYCMSNPPDHPEPVERAYSTDVTIVESDVVGGAYPAVQPMRAALYFENVEGFGDWQIWISSGADKALRKARMKDAKMFGIIIKKIKELSSGHFSPDNQKRLNGTSTEIPIFEAKMTRDLRLVYQIDCIPEYDSDLEIQVIKIYGIYTHAQLDGRFWDSIGHQLARKGKDYSKRCNFRNRIHLSNRDVTLPGSFPPPEESVLPIKLSTFPQLPVQHLDGVHALLDLEKYVALSQALLSSMLANQDVQHVFSVSRRENEIIKYPYSCYVLGRSGTGKTTTMLFKMLRIERAQVMCSGNIPKPRQLFVTQSRMLVGEIEEYFAKLLESSSYAYKSRQELIEISKAQKLVQEQKGLVDLDDITQWRCDLPTRFSLLLDEHFPLFLTFDHLCKLLEADIVEHPGLVRVHNSKNLVSPSIFQQYYWPHLPQKLTKGLDPSMVFSEVLGVIKGSEEALASKDGFLDHKGYEDLGDRTQPAFAHQRVIIYQIFQSYCRLKQKRGEYDAADRTHTLIQSLGKYGVPGQQVDFLYVDEAQDNLLIDAMVLRALCKSPNGLFWAGDTAQTIAVGSSFRFDDLKSFLFRIEEKCQERDTDSGIAQPAVVHDPQMFQLTINYRSHGGIVNCAHSIIELITRFWPYSIDNVAQEEGVVDGSKPLFLGINANEQDSATYEPFLFNVGGGHIEFGAQQCIIVRNEAARIKLREQVGDIGIIMTPYESKGLEFNDVLLYHFFQDSTMNFSQWRVILDALKPAQRSAIRVPSFNKIHHAGMCNELKILYVSITRARKNVWIMDSSEASEPMRVFWAARDLVTTISGPEVPSLGVSSSPEEWERSARSLFNKQRYAHAMQCFQRASLHREAAVANAYLLLKQARAVVSGQHNSSSLRSSAFATAAEAFVDCASSASVEKRDYHRTAAECFKECDKPAKAARHYLDAEEFDSAAEVYCDSGNFDEAVLVVRNHNQTMKGSVVHHIITECGCYYFRTGRLSQGRALFDSDEEALRFTEKHELNEARVSLLSQANRLVEAANVLISLGQTLRGHQILVQDFENEHSMHRVIHYIINGLWQHLSLGLVKQKGSRREVDRLLHLATQLNDAMLDPTQFNEISIFRAITSTPRDLPQLRELGRKFVECRNLAAAILCFDHVFDVSTCSTPSVIGQQALDHMPDFFEYARQLLIVAGTDPSTDMSVQKLLGIQTPQQYLFLIPTETELYNMFNKSRIHPDRATEEGIRVSGQKLSDATKILLRDRLRQTLSLVGGAQEIQRWPLSSRILFMRDVIYDKLPIDTAVLCEVLEKICGLVIILHRLGHRTRGTLHNMVLPQSWLLILLKDFKNTMNHMETDNLRETWLSRKIVQPLAVLFRRIHSKSRPEPHYRAYLSRLCRCLCLLGYNIPVTELQLEILRVISSLPSNLSHVHNLAYYKNAQNWTDLVTAMYKYAVASLETNLIQLHHESQKQPESSVLPVGVVRVIYEDVHDIPALIIPIDPLDLEPFVTEESPVIDGKEGVAGAKGHHHHHVKQVDLVGAGRSFKF